MLICRQSTLDYHNHKEYQSPNAIHLIYNQSYRWAIILLLVYRSLNKIEQNVRTQNENGRKGRFLGLVIFWTEGFVSNPISPFFFLIYETII